MTIEHDVKHLVINIAPKNLGDPQPNSFEEQLQDALNAQNAGTYDNWTLVNIIEVPFGSSKKSLTLIFEREV